MPIICATPTCDRRGVRRVPSESTTDWFCTWHPDREPPPLRGDVYVAPEPEKKPRTLPAAARPTLQQELDTLEQTDSVVAEAAAQYAQAVARITSKPRTATAPTKRTPADPRPADGLCTRGCGKHYRHPGRCRGVHGGGRGPTPKPLDPTDVARRYQAGATLDDLANEMHVAVRRIRTILLEQDIPIRLRGQVVNRKPAAALDPQRCPDLYAAGHSIREVARALGVQAARVAAYLRDEGLLRERRAPTSDVRVRLEPTLAIRVRDRADELGLPVTEYARQLLLRDLSDASQAGAA